VRGERERERERDMAMREEEHKRRGGRYVDIAASRRPMTRRG